MFRVSVITILWLFSSQLYAAKGSGFVERIYINNNKVLFRLKGDECKSKAVNSYWFFELNNDQGKATYALLLAAANSNKVIQVGYPECDSSKTSIINYLYQDF